MAGARFLWDLPVGWLIWPIFWLILFIRCIINAFPSSGLRTVYEQISFLETIINSVVKDALINSTSLQMQVAALYLYYALYHKQPLLNFVKMRLTPPDMDKMQEFLRLLNARPQQYHQPLLVLKRLWSESAFLFVAEEQEVLKVMYQGIITLKRQKKGDQLLKPEPVNLRMEMEEVFDEEEGLLARIEMLEVAYNEMKDVLGGQDPNLAESNVYTSVTQQLSKVAELLNKTTNFPQPTDDREVKTTRRDLILDKISAIQRSKNTLPDDNESRAGPSSSSSVKAEPIVVEDKDAIYIDASFLRGDQKRAQSYAQRVIAEEKNKKKKKSGPPVKRRRK